MSVKVGFIFAVIVMVMGVCVFVLPGMGKRETRRVRETKQAVRTEQTVCKEVGMGGVVSNTKDVKSVSWLHVTSLAGEALKEAYAAGGADMQLAVVIQGYS